MKKPERNREREELVRAAVNGSPYYKCVHMRVVEFTDDGSVMEMDMAPELANVWGTMHGGALASLMDSSCGTSVGQHLSPDEWVVTLDLRVQFYKPVRPGETLTARGRMVHRTRRQAFTECEVVNPGGDLVGRGSGIHIIIEKKVAV